ncbi:uncharacterized protein N7477_001664 [Penicillium maclennaniae]|uniref:uncharacterized protein n=1 Tax=Penicillium maclennaniae TaxID=1343394 RepID=UPI002540F9BB|nr:uncharacterized protein N7477_001664 [Penicillium maclennaniae]KAJ5681724.1 hypothetical protein N7477_001664 [Penicillium maclennaniae]
MAVVAVAGGTGGVGKTIVERLVQEAKFDVLVLSRSTPKQDATPGPGRFVQIDYNDITSMTKELERHNVHTIISALGLISDAASQSQLNLIDAAERSSVTKRFIPSEYSFIQTPDLLPIDPSIQWWLDAAEKLKASSLEYTRVIPGFFMDYWGMPNIKTNLSPYTFGIDISSGSAAIPGDGSDWPEFSVIVGDQVTYNQILAMAEEITGKKFKVSYDTLDQIQAGEVTVPPMPRGIEYQEDELKETTALVSRLTVNGVFDLPKENRLNERFPNVQPITMRKLLEKAWRG